ncbi:hypothetical protein A6V36_10975 [Paraburkholderia ginsengiterrae]|uniref:Uncharacterized protein n=1 Tax=Paraburkholderia ginsengiterrae TaxID=1462993 RepID=A0A1A9NEK4_9BURK|nr:hypothetical protein A6V36_10975 [Paraburkholderia ginsengiterrae]OAJ64689.1 hypothetical protein A6V37_18335 [Paraburkholderia ginsengiterrae]
MSVASERLGRAKARQSSLAHWTGSKHSTALYDGSAAIDMAGHTSAFAWRPSTAADRRVLRAMMLI